MVLNAADGELGLSSSARFANCIGLYDPDNVCTVYDMAMILWAAMENDICRTFLTERNRVPVRMVRILVMDAGLTRAPGFFWARISPVSRSN